MGGRFSLDKQTFAYYKLYPSAGPSLHLVDQVSVTPFGGPPELSGNGV